MFNDMLILSTAISSFNNAALYSPFFFTVGLLTLPLLFIVYIYGKDFVEKIGWDKNNFDNHISFWGALSLLLWLMLFGGNYAVIRDGISLLPVLISFILFGFMIIAMQKSVQLGYIKKLHNKKQRKIKWLLFIAGLFMTVFSSVLTWWGILLQTSAVLCGSIIGLRLKKDMSLIPWIVIMLTLVVIAVLMQPEYFRFGQLGNLTIVHLLAIVCAGFFAITSIVTKYTNPRERIHHSAYIKLKWLFRIMSLLAFVLFVMTESVPVFVGMTCALGLSEMLSVYHSKNISENVPKLALGMLMVSLGIIIICPVLSALGIIYAVFETNGIKCKDFAGLL